MNNNDFNNNQQFVVSYELLCLLRWLLEHDAEKFKKIISKALTAGLKEEIKQFEQLGDINANPMLLEEVQCNVVEFFSMMESLLQESIKEQAVQVAVEKKLMTTIDHIDSAICNDALVRSSLEKATAKSEISPAENAHDILYKELLKQWKPTKNMMN